MVEWHPNVVCNCEHAEVCYDEYDRPYLLWQGKVYLCDGSTLKLTIPRLRLDFSNIKLVCDYLSNRYERYERSGESLTFTGDIDRKLTITVSQYCSSKEALFSVEEIN